MKEEHKLTLADLREKQSWTLAHKIDHSLSVIEAFLAHTNRQAYVSFSGGKDSTILLQLARIVKPDIKAVFCNTGVEFPDIVKFVRKQENVEIIRPEKNFQQVVEEFGFPLVSKTHSDIIYKSKHNRGGKVYHNYFLGEKKSMYNTPKYAKYLIDEPYDICGMCCQILKKDPAKKYLERTGLLPMTGELADESLNRATQWVRAGGCNAFKTNNLGAVGGGKSKPLTIWTEKDIWDYININNLPISDIYYKGATRTGCAGCAFGAHLEKQSMCRYKLLYDLYPNFYKYFMNVTNNGVTYREAIRTLFNKTNKGRYLPDEKPLALF